MNHERVKTLIDCYGADAERWPQEEMEAAIMLIDNSPELIAYQDDARALDKLINNQNIQDDIDTHALASRIMDSLPQQEQTRSVKAPYFAFASAATVALIFVSTWLLQPVTMEAPFVEINNIAQTEFEEWAWEETLDQTPLTLAENNEPADEWSFMEI
ncbi:MAG: hypothetical protein OEW89_00880 [Gammaproteobacteria bacterium]|nr:hypothetical protein [Gammaproteobacteria bacterium]MDH5593140.1 hypothetical protein [Gammaproteobacteria bacterium]